MTEETELVWTEVSDLEIGEHFTLGENCVLTFVVREKFVGKNGKIEVDTTVLAGPNHGRAYDKRFFRPGLEILVVPDEHVGSRTAAALNAFHSRQWRGSERITLPDSVWPHTASQDVVEVCS